ncbi:MAG: hypothetical protein JWL77_1019 [Chthonomonadaceae bacterium]|nr:hypothetical protein [Chthonomonadaceae bacterium]
MSAAGDLNKRILALRSAKRDATVYSFAIDERAQLMQDPSRKNWDRELRRTIAGDRYSFTREKGIVEYLSDTLAACSQESLAEHHFIQALRDFVAEWSPVVSQSPDHMAAVLGIIKAFKPTTGFDVVLQHLQKGYRFKANGYPSEVQRRAGDLHRQALDVLAHYVPKRPHLDLEHLRCYTDYVAVLQEHLNIDQFKEYHGYIAARLIELDVWTSGSDSVSAWIYDHHYAVNGMLDILARFGYEKDIRVKFVTDLFLNCHHVQMTWPFPELDELLQEVPLNLFEDAVKSIHGYIDPIGDGLKLGYPGGSVTLKISDKVRSECTSYMDRSTVSNRGSLYDDPSNNERIKLWTGRGRAVVLISTKQLELKAVDPVGSEVILQDHEPHIQHRVADVP